MKDQLNQFCFGFPWIRVSQAHIHRQFVVLRVHEFQKDLLEKRVFTEKFWQKEDKCLNETCWSVECEYFQHFLDELLQFFGLIAFYQEDVFNKRKVLFDDFEVIFNFSILFTIDASSCMLKTTIWLVIIVQDKIYNILNAKRGQHALNIFIVKSLYELNKCLELWFF
jgi:hypothetical protein